MTNTTNTTNMIDDSEMIVRKHQLKLQIQKAIIENLDLIRCTYDIGRTSWETAEKVVTEFEKRKEEKQSRRSSINNFIKKVVDINKAEL